MKVSLRRVGVVCSLSARIRVAGAFVAGESFLVVPPDTGSGNRLRCRRSESAVPDCPLGQRMCPHRHPNQDDHCRWWIRQRGDSGRSADIAVPRT